MPSLARVVDLAHLETLRGSVQTLIVLMVLVSLVGMLWAVLLLRRARDWRIAVLTVVMAIVPVYQTIAVLTETGVWTFSAAVQVKAYVDLAINVLFLVAVFLLEFSMEKRYSAEVRLRVMDPWPSHQPAVFALQAPTENRSSPTGPINSPRLLPANDHFPQRIPCQEKLYGLELVEQALQAPVIEDLGRFSESPGREQQRLRV